MKGSHPHGVILDEVTTLPIHYLDDDKQTAGQRGECDWSGASTTTGRCPRGCSGALSHYANDGHPECEDPIEAANDMADAEVIYQDIQREKA